MKEVVTFDTVEEFWGIYVSRPTDTAQLGEWLTLSRTTSPHAPNLRKSLTTTSSSKAYDRNGKTHKTSTVESGLTVGATRPR